jgi:hypothetical protein
MKSSVAGKSTSHAEVINVSPHGIWLLANEKEYFLPFDKYPWFKDAKISDICNVRIEQGMYLFWSSLDVDLEIDSLENPEKYPLRYR